jgi:hypothetical protein
VGVGFIKVAFIVIAACLVERHGPSAGTLTDDSAK